MAGRIQRPDRKKGREAFRLCIGRGMDAGNRTGSVSSGSIFAEDGGFDGNGESTE